MTLYLWKVNIIWNHFVHVHLCISYKASSRWYNFVVLEGSTSYEFFQCYSFAPDRVARFKFLCALSLYISLCKIPVYMVPHVEIHLNETKQVYGFWYLRLGTLNDEIEAKLAIFGHCDFQMYLENKYRTCSMPLQAFCTMSWPSVNLNLIHRPETWK